MVKVLVVEDEVKLRNELKIFLENNGYLVNTINNFQNILDQLINISEDIILMDINLPGINGEFLLKEIRKNSQVPIIMVTSKNTEIDELISINYGADDYITKPYNPQILLARIERILSRTKNKEEKIEYKDLKLDISKSLLVKDDIKIELSKNELKILYLLLKNKGKIMSRDEIIDYLWNNDEFVDDNTLTVNINRLRNKLLEFDYEGVIETRRGQGYIIV